MGNRTLLTGRAGTGKTFELLSRLAGELRAGRERGSVLLVPTFSQAGHLKRLLLSRFDDVGGFFDESVATFTGLAEMVLAERDTSGRAIGDLLSGLRQDLLLRRALAEIANPVLTPLAGYAGFRRAASEFLKELKQNGRPASELAERMEDVADGRSASVRDRILAFRDLLGAYERLREDAGLLDHEDYLRLTRDVVSSGEGVTSRGTSLGFLGVDGFQNFTELERDLLLGLAAGASETVVTLTLDPALDEEEGEPFAVARETRKFLLDRGFGERHLEGNRRTRSGVLLHIERDLFRPGASTEAGEGEAEEGESFRVLVGADPADEADRIARTIVCLVTRESDRPRYRDIVVVVRDVRRRRALLGAALARHGIPHRIYGPRDLASSPFARSALGLLSVVAGVAERGAVLGLLRSDHIERVSAAEADRLEYRIYESGEPTTSAAWLEFVEEEPESVREFLREVTQAGYPEAGLDGAAAAAWVSAILTHHLVPLWRRESGDTVRDAAGEDRIREESAAHRALTECVARVGDDIAARGGVVSLSDFLDLLRPAVRGAGLPVRDRRLEVVNVIDAREARQWEAPVVFVAGLVEGEFPVNPREDVFLSDEDRQSVNRAGTLALKERLLMREEERFLFYVAMTRARESLYLTYPATDGAGRENLPSLYLDEVLRLFPEERREAWVSRRRLSDPLPEEAEAVAREDAHRRALFGLSRPYRPGTEEEERALESAGLNDLLLADQPFRRALALGVRFRSPPPAALTPADPAGPRSPAIRAHSASSLESFIRCPFKYFAGRTLRLSGPPRTSVAGLDGLVLGDIAHMVLERAFAPVVDGSELVTDGELAVIFDEEFRARTSGIRIGVDEDRARRDLFGSLTAVLAAERRRIEGSGFAPAFLEEEFGFDERRDLVIQGSGGRRVRLRGRMDRIDVSADGQAVVIDYKYSRHGFDKARRAEAEEGEYLQLPIYLLALRDALGLKPAGAWLYPLRDPKTSGYHIAGGPAPDDAEALDAAGLDELLGGTVGVVLDLDDRIRAGEVAIRPRSADECKWCDYGDVCRVEPWMIGGEE